ncbi:MAG: DUF370 domain-containing protein [Oscillospiraceae bacterium]|nr:DUF370 domain-containing protein [Oscillospiraceae bacterium]
MSSFVNIGSGSLVNASRVLSLVEPESAPVKRLIADAKQSGTLIDASQGHKTRSVLLLDSGHAVLSFLAPTVLEKRLNAEREGGTV